MYLIHNVFKSPFPLKDQYRKKHGLIHYDFLDIIKSGKLKSSSKTKNVSMFGRTKGSKHIFLRIGLEDDLGNFYLDPSFLLKTSFYLQLGWVNGEPNTKKIDGRKLSQEQLEKLLQEFSIKVKRRIIQRIYYWNKNFSTMKYYDDSELEFNDIIIPDDKVDEEYNKLNKEDVRDFTIDSNEILVENNIDLKKYLRKIILTKKLNGYEKKDEIIETVKQMYPNVELKDCKIKSGSYNDYNDYVCKNLL
jgi:hypothetical protein